jgi:hypothetical protein
VQPADEEGLMRAVSILGDIAQVVHPAEGSFDLSGYDNPTDAIIAIVRRHPMRQEEIVRTLKRWSPGRVGQALTDLAASGRAQMVERYGVRFWSATRAHYTDKAGSHRSIINRDERR